MKVITLILSLALTMSGSSNLFFHTHRQSLENFQIAVETKQARVAFLGGSITYNPGWRTKTVEYLEKQFPETKFDFVHAGIPSMGSVSGAFRVSDDVFSKGKIDLLFVEAAVNDRSIWTDGAMHIRGMEGIVRHAFIHNPKINIIMMHFVDPGKMKEYRAGKIPEVIQNHEKVARHYNVSTINLAKEVTERIDAEEFTWKDDFKNLHPSPFGQEIYFNSIKTFFEDEWTEKGNLKKSKKTKLPKPIDATNFDHGHQLPIEGISAEGWEYIPKWKPNDKAGTRAGFVNLPILSSSIPGSTLEYKFKGKTIGMIVPAGPDIGIIEFKIDDGEYQTFDLFTKHSRSLHLGRYYILASDLSRKKHTLAIRISAEKNLKSIGTFCRIQKFLVN